MTNQEAASRIREHSEIHKLQEISKYGHSMPKIAVALEMGAKALEEKTLIKFNTFKRVNDALQAVVSFKEQGEITDEVFLSLYDIIVLICKKED